MTRHHQPPSPFRYFNSSPEMIQLLMIMYVRFPPSLRKVKDALRLRASLMGQPG